jgi:uncharacterized protein
MKKIIIFLVILNSITIFSQEITGQWFGILKVPGMQLNLVFNISKTENGFASTMDSPDQKAIGIPVTTTTFENSLLKLAIPAGGIEYEGVLNKNNTVSGNFKQAGQSFELNLSKEKAEKIAIVRPQEPKKPYAYLSEDITFENSIDKITLSGTFTYPKTGINFPVVVLISGSGAQNRDEELMEHKPFLVLSDYLTKNGIAVLRYDDRGTAKSTGNFSQSTTLDFVKDVESAVKYLKTRKEINPKKIGLIGHSEGGVIAPIVASKDKNIAFIVMLAGTGIRGDKLMLLQKELIERQMGIAENEILKGQNLMGGAYEIILKSNNNDVNLTSKINDYFKLKLGNSINENELNSITNAISSKWIQYFLNLDPSIALQKVKCPVLALNGEKDLQVPAKINIEAIKKALAIAGNKKVKTKILPNLNHLFQECKTGSPNEYGEIEQTISPIALKEILDWVLLQTK